jgi:predicted small lipoprotein YifL
MRSTKRLVVLCLAVVALAGCTKYNPSLFPSYDVLAPGPEVRGNPKSAFPDPLTGASMFVVDYHFLAWVAELKTEILKLRKGAK